MSERPFDQEVDAVRTIREREHAIETIAAGLKARGGSETFADPDSTTPTRESEPSHQDGHHGTLHLGEVIDFRHPDWRDRAPLEQLADFQPPATPESPKQSRFARALKRGLDRTVAFATLHDPEGEREARKAFMRGQGTSDSTMQR